MAQNLRLDIKQNKNLKKLKKTIDFYKILCYNTIMYCVLRKRGEKR